MMIWGVVAICIDFPARFAAGGEPVGGTGSGEGYLYELPAVLKRAYVVILQRLLHTDSHF